MKFLSKKIYILLFLLAIFSNGLKVFAKDSEIQYTRENISHYFLGIISVSQNYNKKAFKHLKKVKLLKNRLNNNVKIIVNGGINSMKISKELLQWADGIMIGRQAYRSPLIIHYLDQFSSKSYENYDHDVRINVTEKIVNYAKKCIKNDKNFKLNHITRHMLGLYAGLPGGKIFRRELNEISVNKNQPKAILDLSEKIETIIKSKNLIAA